MMHPATRLSHMGSMVTNSGTYIGVPEHRFMYQGGMGFFHAPHDEGIGMHSEDEHAVEGGIGGGAVGVIDGGDHGGYVHGGFDHGGMADMNQPQFSHGAFGRDQVEIGDEQGGGEQQEGNYAREKAKEVETKAPSQKDVSEKRKKIARPDAKPAKKSIKKSLKKLFKRQIMSAYPRGYGDYQREYEQGYVPVYHEKKHHKTRVDVDVVGKRSVEDNENTNEDHFLF